MRKLWLENGKQRQGAIFNEFTRLKFIRKNEMILRKESLAKKMTDLSSNDFSKEIGAINEEKPCWNCRYPKMTSGTRKLNFPTAWQEAAFFTH